MTVAICARADCASVRVRVLRRLGDLSDSDSLAKASSPTVPLGPTAGFTRLLTRIAARARTRRPRPSPL